jgi:hypothetical protein
MSPHSGGEGSCLIRPPDYIFMPGEKVKGHI